MMIVMAFFSFRRKRRTPSAQTAEPKKETAGMESLKAGKLARFALDRTSRLISEFGPREAGSAAAEGCARKLREELARFCDTSETQSFRMHPAAFYGWLKIAVIVYPVMLLFLWLGLPFLATVAGALLLFLVFREFIGYRPWFERYYPTKDGTNVHGILEPAKEVRQTVIFSGHHDSARLYRYNKLDKRTYLLKVGAPIIAIGIACAVAPLQLLVQLFSGTILRIGLPPIPFIVILSALTVAFPLILPLWRFLSPSVSPGAGDNLISSSMSVELARFYASRRHQESPLQHTRLVFASFDAEEVGLRGSRRWFSDNARLYDDPDVVGWHFNFDCPYYADELTFLVRDVNSTVRLSQQMATGCVEIAKAMGYKAKSQPLPFLAGGTDAAEGARAGLHAVTLTAIPWDDTSRPAVYHTPEDLPQAIEPAAVEEALSIAIKFVDLLDAGKLHVDSPWHVTAESQKPLDIGRTKTPPEAPESEPAEDQDLKPKLPNLKFRRLSKR
ncbi:MAG: M28 family peptidase [Sphaerochaetaceae bacterium]|jgi:hypothetical protein